VPLATPRRTGLVDQVIEQMREAITRGEWPVGRRIPPEPELVSELGVGRNTVREAVRALAHAGLLEVRQGDGTFVRATSELSGAVRRLCRTELREVLQVRRVLEVAAARMAATNRTEKELRLVSEALTQRDAALSDARWDLAAEKDAEFHLLIIGCSHNTLLAELYQGITEAVRASVATAIDRSLPAGELVTHAGLLEALRDRDPERAAREAGGFLDEMLREQADEPVKES
jgi:DNA-binding FadR family transcriptional regulator